MVPRVRNMSSRWLAAATASSAAAVFFEPSIYFYLISHQNASHVLHHINNLGSFLLSLVIFGGLCVVARLSSHPPLRQAAILSVSVTAVNAAGNEYSLLSSTDPSWAAMVLYGMLYGLAGVLFARAFFRMIPYVGTLATALGAAWAVSAAVNFFVSLSVFMGDEDSFWIGLNGAVGLSVLVHVLLVFLFSSIMKQVRRQS